ncbi:MAG: DUF3795 domain-containing protein [Clostridiales bacterium]|nr:DUF3795 domain-containing protein [Clostridiales bacterium]
MMDKNIAYCGLYCCDCIRYKNNVIEIPKKLKHAIIKEEFEKYIYVKSKFNKELNNFDQFMQMLDHIIALECNNPCREGSGCSAFDCEILECCKEKGYSGCWECEELDKCKKFTFLAIFHGDNTKANCRLVKDKGMREFRKSRNDFIIW